MKIHRRLIDAIYFEAAFVAAMMFSFFTWTWTTTVSSIYQARDLNRALAFAQGHFLSYGPETSGAGSLPGNFYYLLLSIPFRLGFGWIGTWYMMLGLFALTLAGIWVFLRRRWGVPCAVVGLFFVYESPLLYHQLSFFWNPSFLSFWIFLSTWGLCRSFDGSSPRPTWFWLFTSLVVSLTLQIHFSALVLILAALILLIWAKSLGLARPSKTAIAAGACLFALPFFPFFFSSHPEFHHRSYLSVQLDGVSILARKALAATTAETWSLSGLLSRQFFMTDFKIWLSAILAPLGLTLFWKSERQDLPSSEARRTQTVLAVVAACAFIPAAYYLLFSPRASRYAVVESLAFALFATVFAFNKVRGQRARLSLMSAVVILYAWPIFVPESWQFLGERRQIPFLILSVVSFGGLVFCVARTDQRRFGWGTFVFSVLIFLVLVNRVSFFNFKLEKPVLRAATIDDFKAMSQSIYKQTGWTYSEARKRLYYLYIEDELTPEFIYNSIAEQAGKSLAAESTIDGFFVMSQPEVSSGGPPESDLLLEWFRNQPMEESLATAIKDGRVRLGEPERANRLILIPYFVPDKLGFPAYFQNFGTPYEVPTPDEARLVNTSQALDGRPTLDGALVFTWNPCAAEASRCSTGTVIRREAAPAGRIRLHISIVGAPLSVPTEWVLPKWTQSWSRPSLSIVCGGRSSQVMLAETVGYREDMGFELVNAFLAPFDREIELQCEGPLTDVAFSWEGATVSRESEILHLPGQKIEMHESQLQSFGGH